MTTLQQVFDKVALHLLTQKQKSMEGAKCMYRGVGGTMCAVGCLIKDEEYSRNFEGFNPAGEAVRQALSKSLQVPYEDLWKFHALLLDMQAVHDHMEPYGWCSALEHAARKHNLEWTWRVQPEERAVVASVLDEAANYVWDGKTDRPNMAEGEAYSEFTSLYLLNEVRKYHTDYIKFAQELVYSRMKNHGDMCGFLQDKGVPREEITQELLQLHRKQWLGKLAEELRGKEPI